MCGVRPATSRAAGKAKPRPARGHGDDDSALPRDLSEQLLDAGLVFPERAPNCYTCEFFQITHEVSFPRACNRLGFKGKELPSHFLFNLSGLNCPWFVARASPETASP